jgi:phosphate-selective porin
MKKALIIIILGCFTISFTKAQSTNDILNLLIQNKTISQQQADSIRAEAAIKQQDAEANKKSFLVSAAKQIQLSGYTQFRYQNLDLRDKIDGFDIRRARLDLKGIITPYWGYKLQAEFAGTPKIIDAYGEFKYNSYLNLTLGQFKVPFSLENTSSTSKLEAIDLSQVVEALTGRSKDVIGNQNGNDIGIQINGSFLKINDKPLFDYYIGIFNGSGINISDKNENKSIAGRLLLHPAKGLDLGYSIYNGIDVFGTPASNHKRNRWGVELKYELKQLSIRSEFIQGSDSNIERNGWYFQTGYYLIPQKLQLIFKYDTFDPNLSIQKDITTNYSIVMNYAFNAWARIQTGYTFCEEQEGANINNNMGVIQFQIGF